MTECFPLLVTAAAVGEGGPLFSLVADQHCPCLFGDDCWTDEKPDFPPIYAYRWRPGDPDPYDVIRVRGES